MPHDEDRQRVPGTLLEAVDLLLLDLDGVLYTGPDAVPSAVQVLGSTDVSRTFITNNASRPPEAVAEHLRALGIEARSDQVVTSAQAGAKVLADRLEAGARVLTVGGPGVEGAVRAAGLSPVSAPDPVPDAVLQGFGRDVGWAQLCDATVAIAAGALWVATNTDLTIPTERGTMPGNGTLVAAVRTATGVEPLVAAKPEPGIFRDVVDAVAARAPLAVGDRLDTDIAGARAAGLDALLVLTGVSSPADVVAAGEPERPTHLGVDLRALQRPPLVIADLVPAQRRFTLRGASAWVEGDVVHSRLETGTETGEDEEAWALLDVCAVVCAAAWSSPGATSPTPDAATGRALSRLRDLSRPRPSA